MMTKSLGKLAFTLLTIVVVCCSSTDSNARRFAEGINHRSAITSTAAGVLFEFTLRNVSKSDLCLEADGLPVGTRYGGEQFAVLGKSRRPVRSLRPISLTRATSRSSEPNKIRLRPGEGMNFSYNLSLDYALEEEADIFVAYFVPVYDCDDPEVSFMVEESSEKRLR